MANLLDMKKIVLICFAIFGFAFMANAQVCKTEGQKCVTKDGDRGACREVTVTQTTTSTIGSSNTGTSGYNLNGTAKVGGTMVGGSIGGGYNSSNTRSNSNQKSMTETESWKEIKCKKQDDEASKATPAW